MPLPVQPLLQASLETGLVEDTVPGPTTAMAGDSDHVVLSYLPDRQVGTGMVLDKACTGEQSSVVTSAYFFPVSTLNRSLLSTP